MKWAGMLLVLISASALGMNAGKRLRQRYYAWMELKLFIGILKGELQYGADPLRELFERISERISGEFSLFFLKTAEEMARPEGRGLTDILRENADRYLKQCGLSGREREQLVNLCAMLGRMDRESQICALNGYFYTIQQEEKIALEKVRQKETMYRCLGVMGGLFFAILLY